ncbi:MAG: hypothetical protein WKF52_02905 [Sphingomicrobium sp.]
MSLVGGDFARSHLVKGNPRQRRGVTIGQPPAVHRAQGSVEDDPVGSGQLPPGRDGGLLERLFAGPVDNDRLLLRTGGDQQDTKTAG